jgi:spore germination protein YaaH
MIVRYLAGPVLLLLLLTATGRAQSIHELESRRHSEERSMQPGEQSSSKQPGEQSSSKQPDVQSPSTQPAAPVAPRAMPLAKRVFGWVPYWIAPAQWDDFDWSALTTIGYFSLEADTSGRALSMHGWPAPALRDAAHAHGVKVMLTVTSFGSTNNTELLGVPARRSRLVATIVYAVVSGGGDGVNIDFEVVPAAQRDNLTAFMRELAGALRAAISDAEISMAIPAVDWSNAFDVMALTAGGVCDYLIMMGYDYHWSTAPTAGPVAPLAGENLNVTKSVDTYLAKGLASERLLLGVPWYGFEWPTVGEAPGSATTGRGRPVLYGDARENAPLNGRMFDTATSTPWYRYFVGDSWYQVWYDDSVSLALKYRLANDRRLGGIGIWALGYQGESVDAWQGIHQAFDLPTSIAESDRSSVRIEIDRGGIRFGVDHAMRVKIELVDAIGRRAATIVDAERSAGEHRAMLGHDELPRGLYLLVANTGAQALPVIIGE